ncbi:MFS transporter [Baaleninema simplex]|uniref:MFS transporter n=1 Tax=Baaleninema simplex TaxID=2862350 RepID=UPI0003757DAE|nr:MFS transporter [Baaleninema simplex]
MHLRPRLKKFGLLGSLYLSQFVPFWFLYQALPILLRQKGMSLEAIGLLPAILLPISLKFLWSPFIDAYGFTRWGHYRFWIIFFQLWVAGVTVFCGFLSIEENLPLLLVGLLLIAIGSGSQDIATDALAVRLLNPEERGAGNAVQGIGGAIGRTIGGGGMLILLNRWGWRSSLLSLAAITIAALVPLLFYREPVELKSRRTQHKFSLHPKFWLRSAIAYVKIFIETCQRPGIKSWLAILALMTAGYNLSATMFRPLLVDIGWSLEEIGWLLGVFGMTMTIFGSLVAGSLVSKIGRKRSFLVALSLTTVGILTQVLPTLGWTQPPILYGIVSLSFFAMGITGTTTFTIMMDNSRRDMAATDYTLQTSVIPLCSILSAALSGSIAGAIGYRSVFLMSAAILIGCIGFVYRSLHTFESDRVGVGRETMG